MGADFQALARTLLRYRSTSDDNVTKEEGGGAEVEDEAGPIFDNAILYHCTDDFEEFNPDGNFLTDEGYGAKYFAFDDCQFVYGEYCVFASMRALANKFYFSHGSRHELGLYSDPEKDISQWKLGELIEVYDKYKSKPVLTLDENDPSLVWQPLDKGTEDLITKYKTLREEKPHLWEEERVSETLQQDEIDSYMTLVSELVLTAPPWLQGLEPFVNDFEIPEITIEAGRGVSQQDYLSCITKVVQNEIGIIYELASNVQPGTEEALQQMRQFYEGAQEEEEEEPPSKIQKT